MPERDRRLAEFYLVPTVVLWSEESVVVKDVPLACDTCALSARIWQQQGRICRQYRVIQRLKDMEHHSARAHK